MLVALYNLKNRNQPWMRRHPIDAAYGTATNGDLPPWLLSTGSAADAHTTAYAGCHPSALRDALASIPGPERRSFVDLGCGKGRALLVASEQPFRRILGIELAPGLVATARRNAAILARGHPDRTPIEVRHGDATAFALPDGDLVVFFYHAFGRPLIATVLATLAAAAAGREIFLVYENPVHGDMMDAAGLARWHARTVPGDPDEAGCAEDDSETIVAWRLGAAPRDPPADASTPIVVTKPGWKAMLLTDTP